jgi:hypothetical protein
VFATLGSMRLRWEEVTSRTWEGLDRDGVVRASDIRGDFPPAWVAYVRPGGGPPVTRVGGHWATRREASAAAEAALDAQPPLPGTRR